MRLSVFLDQAGLRGASFARAIGVTPKTVWRYCNGERIPEPAVMAAIVRESNGQVEPNDFYPACQKLLSRFRSAHRANGTKTNGKSARQTRMTS